MVHLPILRQGVPHKSLDVVTVPHYRTREPFVEISQANAGLIRRDLRPERQAAARQALVCEDWYARRSFQQHADAALAAAGGA